MAMYVKGNQAETAIRFLEHMLQASDDLESRQALEAQLQQARLEKIALRLDDAVAAYRAEHGLLPLTVEVLRATGFVKAILPDPYGGSWRIDEEGRVHSTVHDQRIMRPETDAQRDQALGRLRNNLKNTRLP